MLTVNAQVLKQPKIQTSNDQTSNIFQGRINLDGSLFEPKPISKLVITYFGDDYETKEHVAHQFCTNLLEVRFLRLVE